MISVPPRGLNRRGSSDRWVIEMRKVIVKEFMSVDRWIVAQALERVGSHGPLVHPKDHPGGT
jgi:hypothetical protein